MYGLKFPTSTSSHCVCSTSLRNRNLLRGQSAARRHGLCIPTAQDWSCERVDRNVAVEWWEVNPLDDYPTGGYSAEVHPTGGYLVISKEIISQLIIPKEVIPRKVIKGNGIYVSVLAILRPNDWDFPVTRWRGGE